MQRLAFPLSRWSRCARTITNLPLRVQQRMASSYPTIIRPSATEITNGQLTPQNLEIAIRSLYHDGLVVVENAVPHAALDWLNEKMVPDAYTLQSRREDSPYNYNRGNIQQDPPPVKDYFDRDVFLSKCRAPRRDQVLLTVSSQTQLPRR